MIVITRNVALTGVFSLEAILVKFVKLGIDNISRYFEGYTEFTISSHMFWVIFKKS
jgi:hypothetical protein